MSDKDIVQVVVTALTPDHEIEIMANIVRADGEREPDDKILAHGNEESRPVYLEDGDSITIVAKVVGTYTLNEEQGSVSLEPVEDPEDPPPEKRLKK